MEPQGAQFYTDPTFWVAVAFFIFVGLMLYLRLPGMIAKALDKRAEKIKSQLEEARALKEEAQGILAQMRRKHRDAKKEAKDIMALAKEEAELFAKEAEKNMEAAVERQVKASEEKIAQAEANAVREVKGAAADAAVRAAGTLLEEQLKRGKNKPLADQAIKKLDKRLN